MGMCRNARILSHTVDLNLPSDDPSSDIYERNPPGPVPLEVDSILQGRMPAFEESALDDRIEYLFEKDGLVDTCMKSRTGVPGNLVLLFRYLWGPDAPIKFQSIVVFKGKVYEIEEDDDNGNVMFGEYKTVRTYLFEGNFLNNFIECIHSICSVSVPLRRPDLKGHASHILEWIASPMNGLTVSDVFEKNDLYEKQRKRAENIVNKANTIREVLKEAISLTTIKKSNMK
jgi:hypothetical protein